jgi:hypothetical protein
VEAEPDTIARLLGTVRQARRGLARIGSLPEASRGGRVLAEAEAILAGALHVTERASREEPTTAEDGVFLASIPARFAAIEAEAGDEARPRTASIHSHPKTGRALVVGAGPVERKIMVVREPGTPRLFLVVGAHVAYHEGVRTMGDGPALAEQLEQAIREGKTPRPAWMTAFRVAR